MDGFWIKKKGNLSGRAVLEKIQKTDSPLLLGLCSDVGGGILKGAAWGPLYIRCEISDYIGHLGFLDMGDVRVVPHLLHDKYLNVETLKKCRQSLYGDSSSSLPISPLSIAEDFLCRLYELSPSKRLFAMGGDHSCSYPFVKSFLQGRRGKNVALIHFDAHTDLLHERLGMDICFASWTAKILPFLPSPSHCIQLGIRATRRTQEEWESEFGIKQYFAREILSDFSKVCSDLKKYLLGLSVDELYITFDIDALDISHAPCTGTPEPFGLEPHHCVSLIEMLAGDYPVGGADLMEVAPLIRSDKNNRQTTLFSVRTVSSALLQALSQ